MAACDKSATGQYVRPILERASVKPNVVETEPKRPARSRSFAADEDEADLIATKLPCICVIFELAASTSTVTSGHNFDVQQVDEFLAGDKWLEAPPTWQQSSRAGELEAIWNIGDSLGVRAHLRFRVSQSEPALPSLSLIFRRNPVMRLDIEAPTTCHSNPPWAAQLGLPGIVCGSHFHSWDDNRDHILNTGLWVLPARRPVEPGLRRVPQMLPWIADRIGIELSHDDRDFDLPPKEQLL